MESCKIEDKIYILKFRNKKGEEIELRGNKEYIDKKFEDIFDKMKRQYNNKIEKTLLLENE